ncbi:hypothetical protein MKW98_026641 [Papaver atlanticum]|uniref:Uncharacterized protein n=1 Tax=Papaver atlanticum TaxID=357466 RepID=A0AAD4S018_9MAGN|nr:hypothetical protein MKW98_026641 [Papaver atlanticum]
MALQKLVKVKRPLLRVPILAIHLHNTVNKDEFKRHLEIHLVSLLATKLEEASSDNTLPEPFHFLFLFFVIGLRHSLLLDSGDKEGPGYEEARPVHDERVCIWTSLVLFLLAIFNACIITKFTRIAGELVGMLIAILCIQSMDIN